MNDSRDAVLAIIRGTPTRPVVAPLWDGIFVSGLVGKQYATEVTTDELLDAADMCGFDPILRLGADELWAGVPDLQAENRTEQRGDVRRHTATFTCPAGMVETVAGEPPHTGATCIADGTRSPQLYDVIEWRYRRILELPDVLLDNARALADRYGARAPLFISWMTPFELCFLAYPTIIIHYLDHIERHRELMELHTDVFALAARAAAQAGWDGVHTAGPPIELIGMKLYDELAAEPLRRLADIARDAGLLLTFHNCGHIRELLEAGTYNRVGLDLFETLAPPPMGELDDLRWAREQLDAGICTRGNMDLEFLKRASPGDVAARAAEIVEQTAGFQHIVGTCDEILAGTPVENVRAMGEVARM